MWKELFSKDTQPTPQQVADYVGTPYWDAFNEYMQNTYTIEPKIEYSCCSAAPGWNVKYKKSGRSLCVLYPDKGAFTCLVTIGAKEATEAELLLPTCTQYTQDMYNNVQPLNGARWLMIPVTNDDVLGDVKKLIATRIHKK